MKYLKIIMSCMIFTGVIFLAGCGASKSETAEENSGEKSQTELVEDEQELPDIDEVKVDNMYDKAGFVIDKLYDKNKSNIMFSPLSLDMALALLSTGCEGESLEQINAYLGREDYPEYAKEYIELNREEDENGVVNIANAVFTDKSMKLNKNYVNQSKKYFDAKVEALDFGKSQKAADTINKWCSEKTHKLIPEIISADELSRAGAAAILANTIYFKSTWLEEMSEMSDELEFTDADGNKQKAEFIGGDGEKYFENEKAEAFSYSYRNGYEFIGILPKTEGDFEISDLEIKSLMDNGSNEYDINFYMPEMDFETDNDICKEALCAMGVKDIFIPGKADLSGICGNSLYVDDVKQKCNIKLDKYGTEAAAATAMEIMLTSAPAMDTKIIKEIHLDRPFAFMIIDSHHTELLFAGKMSYIN